MGKMGSFPGASWPTSQPRPDEIDYHEAGAYWQRHGIKEAVQGSQSYYCVDPLCSDVDLPGCAVSKRISKRMLIHCSNFPQTSWNWAVFKDSRSLWWMMGDYRITRRKDYRSMLMCTNVYHNVLHIWYCMYTTHIPTIHLHVLLGDDL